MANQGAEPTGANQPAPAPYPAPKLMSPAPFTTRDAGWRSSPRFSQPFGFRIWVDHTAPPLRAG